MTAGDSPPTAETFVRLKRDRPWGQQVGCSLMIAIVLLGISGTLTAIDPFGGGWMGLAVIVVFGGIGLLMLFMFVHQLIAMRVPETVVEISPHPVITGVPARVRFTQSGPVRLRSLRANVGWDEKDSEGTVFGGTENFLKVRDLEIGESWTETVDLVVPENGRPSGWSGDVKTTWKIEIWGHVRFFPDFLHAFVIRVKKPEDETIRRDCSADGNTDEA